MLFRYQQWQGYAVAVAGSGCRALAMIQIENFDLVQAHQVAEITETNSFQEL
jgi:hypothetical protein